MFIKTDGRSGYWVKCIVCGADIFAQRSSKKFCSNACTKKHHRKMKSTGKPLRQAQNLVNHWRQNTDLKSISDEDLLLLRNLRGSLDGLLNRSIQLKQEVAQAESNKVEMTASQRRLLALMNDAS